MISFEKHDYGSEKLAPVVSDLMKALDAPRVSGKQAPES